MLQTARLRPRGSYLQSRELVVMEPNILFKKDTGELPKKNKYLSALLNEYSDPACVVEEILEPHYREVQANTRPKFISKEFFPGTFVFGRAKKAKSPAFGRTGKLNRKRLVEKNAVCHLNLLENNNLLHFFALEKKMIAKAAAAVFTFKNKKGIPLMDLIAEQEFTDTLWAVLKMLIGHNKYVFWPTFQDINAFGEKLAISLINDLRLQDMTLRKLIKLSILTGLVGINLKEEFYKDIGGSGVGPSLMRTKNIIRLNRKISLKRNVENAKRELLSRLNEKMEIDDRDEYLKRLKKTQRICFFTDDFIETIFDLHWIQRQVEIFPGNKVILIPQASRFGNDFSFLDIERIINLSSLRKLKRFIYQGRVIPFLGPQMGGINFLRLPYALLRLIAESDLLVVRGARAFEMAQDVEKPIFFGFNVVREYTESLVGLSAEAAPPVFIFKYPRERCFGSFRGRSRPIRMTGPKRARLSQYTALEYFAKNKEVGNVH